MMLFIYIALTTPFLDAVQAQGPPSFKKEGFFKSKAGIQYYFHPDTQFASYSDLDAFCSHNGLNMVAFDVALASVDSLNEFRELQAELRSRNNGQGSGPVIYLGNKKEAGLGRRGIGSSENPGVAAPNREARGWGCKKSKCRKWHRECKRDKKCRKFDKKFQEKCHGCMAFGCDTRCSKWTKKCEAGDLKKCEKKFDNCYTCTDTATSASTTTSATTTRRITRTIPTTTTTTTKTPATTTTKAQPDRSWFLFEKKYYPSEAEMWGSGQPSSPGDCVVMDPKIGYKLRVEACNSPTKALCGKRDLESISTLSPPTTPTTQPIGVCEDITTNDEYTKHFGGVHVHPGPLPIGSKISFTCQKGLLGQSGDKEWICTNVNGIAMWKNSLGQLEWPKCIQTPG